MKSDSKAQSDASQQSGKQTSEYGGNELLQALKRLDLLLERAVAQAENTYTKDALTDPFRGMHINKQQIDDLLSIEPGAPLLWQPYEAADREDVRVDDSGNHDHESRLTWIKQAFALSSFEMDVILIALAAELDLRYEQLFAYLQDHVAKKRPTVDLVLNLLCPSAEAKLEYRRYFTPDAPLIQHRLVLLMPDPNQVDPNQVKTSLLAQTLQLDGQILRLLLDQQHPDPRLAPFCQCLEPKVDLSDLVLADEIKTGLHRLATGSHEAGQALHLYFHGPKGIGKRRCAEALAGELGLSLLICDLSRISAAATGLEHLPGCLFREAWFQDAILYIDHADRLSDDNSATFDQDLLDALLRDNGITIMAGLMPWQPSLRHPLDLISVPFRIPDYTERRHLWTAELAFAELSLDEQGVDKLADRFRLTLQQIRNAVSTAKSNVCWKSAAQSNIPLSSFQIHPVPILNIEDLYYGARAQSGHDLAALTQKIEPNYSWDDIVLLEDSKTQLLEICQRVEHRHQVLGDWGFDRKLSLGKGVNALFAGPSGTGKTMASEIIANALQLDLYRIDLSSVVSKYIGETEKNLDRIFRAAEDANAILLCDEAEALFGKRSEVRDAHDRYANIEIAYLLQKMEQYDGIAILSTNLKSNLDEAFTRRLSFMVHFPFPDEASRQQIWARAWPSGTPLEEDVDLDTLAKRFKLSGGNIKNVALAAAFLAAEDNSPVTMAHLLKAVRREYQKMGKALSEEELNGVGGERQKLARIAG